MKKNRMIVVLMICLFLAVLSLQDHSGISGSDFLRIFTNRMTVSAAEDQIPLDKAHFPGWTFRQYLGSSYDKNKDGVLSQEEIADIRTVKMVWTNEYGMTEEEHYLDITGIKYFQGVQTVSLEEWLHVTGMKELEQLPSLKKLSLLYDEQQCEPLQLQTDVLEELTVRGNWRKELDFRYLPNLKVLNLGDSKGYSTTFEKKEIVRKKLDLSANPKLEKLFCTDLGITKLNLSKNPKLVELNCNSNRLKSIDLGANKKLKVLYCSSNYLKKLVIGKLKKLKTLECAQNQIERLQLHRDMSLQHLDVSGNKLKKLDIRNMKKLKTLICTENKIKQLYFHQNKALQYLDISSNVLKKLDITQCSRLSQLECGINDITQFKFNKELTWLHCSMNRLKKLDVSKQKKLIEIDCPDNGMRKLKLPDSSSMLTKLTCERNNLRKLDVSKQKKLENIDCDDNNIKYLDLSKQKKLRNLSCEYNKIIKLELPDRSNLRNLFCSHNKLSGLDLSKQDKLRQLACSYNKISKLDLRKQHKLNDLSCGHNRISTLDLRPVKKTLSYLWIVHNNMKHIYLVAGLLPVVLDDDERTDERIAVFIQGNRFHTIDMTSIESFDGIDKEGLNFWITNGGDWKYTKKITTKKLVASRKLSQSERQYLQKLGKKYRLKIKYI